MKSEKKIGEFVNSGGHFDNVLSKRKVWGYSSNLGQTVIQTKNKQGCCINIQQETHSSSIIRSLSCPDFCIDIVYVGIAVRFMSK